MKKLPIIVLLLLTVLFCMTLFAGEMTFDRKDEIVLEYYQLLSKEVFQDAIDFLKKVAQEDYSKAGEWERIKKDFTNKAITQENHNENAYSALYFYIKPNGDYYTHIRNFTGVSLADREYFPMLKRGDEVLGYPVIGKTTGRKSAVFAIPVKQEDKITGYTAMSVFIEEVNADLNTKMQLDSDMLTLALNDNGTIMLSSSQGYLFRDISDLITAEKKTVMEIFNRNKSGSIEFSTQFSAYHAIFKRDKTTTWTFLLAQPCSEKRVDNEYTDMEKTLERTRNELARKIGNMEIDLIHASEIFSHEKKLPEDIRSILNRFYEKNTSIYGISFIDTQGIMRYMTPEITNDYEGSEVSTHEQVIEITKNKKPNVSNLFTTVEGFEAIDIEWPVFNIDGKTSGSLSAILKPSDFFGSIIKENLEKKDYEIWIMQANGTIIYDSDFNEIGKNLFTDEIYADYDKLRELGKKIITNAFGSGDYEFTKTSGNKIVHKKAVWNTITLHEKEWKLIIISE